MLRMYARGRWVGFVEPYRAVHGVNVCDAYRDADGTIHKYDLHDAWVFHDGTVDDSPERQHAGSSGDADELWNTIVSYVEWRAAEDFAEDFAEQLAALDDEEDGS